MSRILLIVSILLSLLLLMMLIVPRAINWSDYKKIVENKIQQTVGQKIHIKGQVDLNLLPIPSIKINEVYAFHDKQQIFFAKQIDISIAPIPIITGQIILEKFNILKPVFHIIEDQQKYISIIQNLNINKNNELQNIFVHGIKIQNAKIIMQKKKGGNIFEIDNLNATHNADFASGPHNIKGDINDQNGQIRFKLKIFGENQKIKLAGNIIAKKQNQNIPLKIKLEGDIQNIKKKITDIQINAKINLLKGNFEQNYDLWKINNDNSIKNLEFFIKAKKDNITIEQIKAKIKKNKFNEKTEIKGSINIKLNQNNLVKTKLEIDFFEIAQENGFKKIVQMFKKVNTQNIEQYIHKFNDNIHNLKAQINIGKLIVEDKLFQNTSIKIDKNKDNNIISIKTKYDKDNDFYAQIEKNKYWKTKIFWKTDKFRYEIKKLLNIFDEFANNKMKNIKFQEIPLKTTIKINANNQNQNLNIQKILVKYDDKTILADINTKKQTAILNIDNVQIDKWAQVTQSLWKYHNDINADKQKKSKINWQIRINKSKWKEFYIPHLKAELELINSSKNTQIDIIKASIENENSKQILETAAIKGNIFLNYDGSNNYYIDKGKIQIKAQKIEWKQYLADYIKNTNIQRFLDDNPLQQLSAEIYANTSKNTFAFAVNANAKIGKYAKTNFSIYHETKSKNDSEFKISASAVNIPIKKIIPNFIQQENYQDKADFRIFVSKKYHKKPLNLDLKIKYQDKAYKIKADVFNDYNNNLNATGLIYVNNKNPWNNQALSAKAKTDIKAKIKWQNQVIKITSQKGIINDNNTKFAITIDNKINKAKLNKFNATLYLEKINLNKIVHYLTGEPQNDVWKSKLPLKIKWMQNTQFGIWIQNKQLSVNKENIFENNLITIDSTTALTSIKIKGQHQKGDVLLLLKNNNDAQRLNISGKMKITNASPAYLNNALTNISVDFNTKGSNLASITRNLSGAGKFEMHNSYIEGFNGKGMAKIGEWIVNQSEKSFIFSIKQLQGKQYQMPYSNIKGDFDLEKGFFNSSNTRIDAPHYEMNGAVFIDIPLRNIEASFKLYNKTIPKAPGSDMTLKGKWNNINKKINFAPVIGHYNIVHLEKELIRTEAELEPIEKKYRNTKNTPN